MFELLLATLSPESERHYSIPRHSKGSWSPKLEWYRICEEAVHDLYVRSNDSDPSAALDGKRSIYTYVVPKYTKVLLLR